MKMMTKVVASSLLCMGVVMGANAYEAGDMILRVGAITVDPNDDASTPELNGIPLLGTDVGIDSDTQIGLTGTYMLTSNLGLELWLAAPFQHDISGNDAVATAFGTDDLGSTKHLPPTLNLQYYFNNSTPFTPFVGLGINYTKFFSEDAGQDLETTLGGDVDLDLEDSIGLAAEVGVDYRLNESWLLNATVMYADIDTEATYSVKSGALTGVKVKSDVSIDPLVYLFSVGYKF